MNARLTRGLLLAALLGALAFLGWNRIDPDPVPDPAGGASPRDLALESVSRAAYAGKIADAAATFGLFAPKLEAISAEWTNELGIDVQIATLGKRKAAGDPLTSAVFTARNVGAGAKSGGLLILLDAGRSEATIMTSPGLETRLPRALVERIAREQLSPFVSYQTSALAVMDTLAFLKDFAKTAVPGDADPKLRVPDEKRPLYAPSADPMESIAAFERVLRDRVGDPSLELFSEGTRVMRARARLAPDTGSEQLAKLEASKPLRVSVEGERAVGLSASPVRGFLPIFLTREAGAWRIDLVELRKNFVIGPAGDAVLVNSSHPYQFALGAFGPVPAADVVAWEIESLDLATAIRTLEDKPDGFSKYSLGDLLFRNAFLPLEALRNYEAAVREVDGDSHFLATLAERALYLGLQELAIPALERLGEERLVQLAEAHRALGNLVRAEEVARAAVARNPFDRDALGVLRTVLEERGQHAEAAEWAGQIAAIALDPEGKASPVRIDFEPPYPVFTPKSPALASSKLIYDHTRFGVRLTNTSQREIEVDQIVLTHHAQGTQDGIGDVKHFWPFRSSGYRLAPGETIVRDRHWGFTSDKGFTHTAWVFDLCWRGVGSDVRQCRSERVAALPR